MKTPFSPFGRLYKNYSVPNIRRLEVVICLGQMIQECLYSQELSYFLDINQQDITTSLHVMPNWCTFLILLQDVMSREQLIIHSIRTGGAAPILFRPTVTRLKLITSVERTWLHTFSPTQCTQQGHYELNNRLCWVVRLFSHFLGSKTSVLDIHTQHAPCLSFHNSLGRRKPTKHVIWDWTVSVDTRNWHSVFREVTTMKFTMKH